MVVYKCPRCNYTVFQRCDIKKHFNRKKPCTIVNEFLSLDECRQKVLGLKSQKSLEVGSFMSQKEEKSAQNGSFLLNLAQNGSFLAHNETNKVPKKEQKSLDLECNNCGKSFNKQFNLLRHLSNCRINTSKKRNYVSMDEVKELLEREIATHIMADGELYTGQEYLELLHPERKEKREKQEAKLIKKLNKEAKTALEDLKGNNGKN